MEKIERENLLNDRAEELKRIVGLALSLEECRIFVNSCLPPIEDKEKEPKFKVQDIVDYIISLDVNGNSSGQNTICLMEIQKQLKAIQKVNE